MLVAYFSRTRLRLSPAVLIMIPAAALFSRLGSLAVLFVSLALHEFAHTVMAHRLGYAVDSIEALPFGFVAELNSEPRSPSDAAAVAAAGPVVSLVASLLSSGLIAFSAGSSNAALGAVREFSFFNLSLGAFNLLPALPLDGGRLALALCSFSSSGRARRRGARVLSYFGVLFGAGIAALGVFVVIGAKKDAFALMRGASFTMTGAFLLLSAFKYLKSRDENALIERFSAHSRLDTRRAIRVFPVAMSSRSTVRDALLASSGGGYGVIYVLDEKKRVLGTVSEGALVAAAVSGGSETRLESLVSSRAIPSQTP